uniref:Putative secreted protein n=1 Tax=Anopheles darlingi TaxID=43151 RepID=A0A2M4DFF0_ANODA
MSKWLVAPGVWLSFPFFRLILHSGRSNFLGYFLRHSHTLRYIKSSFAPDGFLGPCGRRYLLLGYRAL